MISNVQVPFEGPTDAKIYFVGEAPGSDETDARRPFVGLSGLKLRNCIGRNGISEDTVRFTNLCKYQPPGNKFEALLRTRELETGVEELTADLREFRPNVIAALGNWPLYYLTGKRGKKAVGTGIGKWRGSILPCILPGCEGLKVIASYHPAYIARNASAYPIFDTDIKRVVGDSGFPELRYPERNFILDPRGALLDEWVERLCNSEYLAVDIETVKRTSRILCIGFSPDSLTSVVIPLTGTDFDRRDAVAAILASPAKKIFHNGGTFDIPILQLNSLETSNYYWDTMVAQHVMWAELPKSLDYLASVVTRQPYYKTAGRAEIPEDAKGWSEKFDRRAVWEYNGTDTGCTYEVAMDQMREIADGPKDWMKFIRFEMDQMAPANRVSQAGMQIDLIRREKLKRALETKWAILQFILENLVGYKVNVNSTKVMPKILYDKDKLALPPRKNREGGLTTDEDAIVSLIAFTKDKMSKLKPGGSAVVYWRTRLEALNTVLLIRGIRKLLSSYINARISEDGAMRATFRPCAAETGRWACSVFYDGTGVNAQTFPREVFELQNYEDNPLLADALKFIMGMEEEDKPKEDEDEEAVAA